jgi:hypothetical protein
VRSRWIAAAACALLWAACAPPPALAQNQPPAAAGAAEEVESDDDPTRPVFISIRPEFYNIGNDIDRRQLIARYDARVLPTLRMFTRGAPGFILRFEAPFVDVKAGSVDGAGLGDVYGQLLAIPYATRRFAFVAGSGFFAPTATHELTGTDKWTVAPLVAPLWRLPRGLFLVKVQNVTSVAGDDSRPDFNYLLVTPIYLHTVFQRWWVMADTETKTRWTNDGRTGIKSGVQIGRRVRRGIGLWAKPEFWWGPNRDGEWNLRFGLVWYERR